MFKHDHIAHYKLHTEMGLIKQNKGDCLRPQMGRALDTFLTTAAVFNG